MYFKLPGAPAKPTEEPIPSSLEEDIYNTGTMITYGQSSPTPPPIPPPPIENEEGEGEREDGESQDSPQLWHLPELEEEEEESSFVMARHARPGKSSRLSAVRHSWLADDSETETELQDLSQTTR